MWINNSSIFFRYDIYWTQSLAVLDSYDVRQQSAFFDKDAEKKTSLLSVNFTQCIILRSCGFFS